MQFAIAIAFLVISQVAMALLTKKPKNNITFKDFDFPVPDEGTPQTVIFGDVWLGEWQVLWVGNYFTETIRQKQKGK